MKHVLLYLILTCTCSLAHATLGQTIASPKPNQEAAALLTKIRARITKEVHKHPTLLPEGMDTLWEVLLARAEYGNDMEPDVVGGYHATETLIRIPLIVDEVSIPGHTASVVVATVSMDLTAPKHSILCIPRYDLYFEHAYQGELRRIRVDALDSAFTVDVLMPQGWESLEGEERYAILESIGITRPSH